MLVWIGLFSGYGPFFFMGGLLGASVLLPVNVMYSFAWCALTAGDMMEYGGVFRNEESHFLFYIFIFTTKNIFFKSKIETKYFKLRNIVKIFLLIFH